MTAVAMNDAEVYFLSEDALSKQMLSEPALALMVLSVMAAEVRSAQCFEQCGDASGTAIPELTGPANLLPHCEISFGDLEQQVKVTGRKKEAAA